MTESSRPGVGRRPQSAASARLVAAVLAVACALGAQAAGASAAPAPSATAASRAYVLTQRSAGSVSQLVLAPTGLRFSFSAAVRAGGRSRARKMKPFVGIIIRYRGERLTLLDPIHRTYQVLALASAIHSYDAELRVLAKAQPSTELPPAPGTAKTAAGQEKLKAPAARLTPLRQYERIGPVRARAYLLRQGTLQERIWYAAALPGPPQSVRGMLVQALGSSGSGPLGRVLRAHASQIPLRIDERAGKKWRSVLRTTSIVRRRLTAHTLARPRGYRVTGLLAQAQAVPASTVRRDDVPGSPVRCGALLITGVLGCTSLGAELTGLAGPISEHPAVWAYYWGDAFKDHLDYVSALNHGLENMVGDQFADPSSPNFWEPLAQYGVHQGSFLGDTVVDDNPAPSVGSWDIFDVEWFILSHRWGSDAPHYWWRWSSQDPIFAIFIDGSQVENSPWAGYHAFAVTEGILFSFLVHPAMPFFIIKTPALSGIGHDRDAPAFENAVDIATERASHEFVEAATDPYPFTSWADPLKEPIWDDGEIADICQVGSSAPWAKNTRLAPYGTAVEPYWSNDDQACVPKAQPDVTIVQPQAGGTYPWDSQVPFEVTTNDLFDNGPVADSAITWNDDVAGAGFGHGSAFGDTKLTPGDHHISVTAVDSQEGERTVGPITIHVVVEPPHVEIDHPADGTTFGNDQTISFRGEAIDPEQGDIGPSATWSLDGTSIGTGAALLEYKIATPGTHTLTLSATNGGGATSSASITVHVVPGTGAPSVSITSPPDNTNVAAGTPITFTASATTASGATIPDADISWTDDLDGALGTGHTITTTLTGSGCQIYVHHVTVTATDTGNGQSATDEVTVNDGGIC
jgi:Bacterial Ig domain